jgi:hypothetical protein
VQPLAPQPERPRRRIHHRRRRRTGRTHPPSPARYVGRGFFTGRGGDAALHAHSLPRANSDAWSRANRPFHQFSHHRLPPYNTTSSTSHRLTFVRRCEPLRQQAGVTPPHSDRPSTQRTQQSTQLPDATAGAGGGAGGETRPQLVRVLLVPCVAAVDARQPVHPRRLPRGGAWPVHASAGGGGVTGVRRRCDWRMAPAHGVLRKWRPSAQVVMVSVSHASLCTRRTLTVHRSVSGAVEAVRVSDNLPRAQRDDEHLDAPGGLPHVRVVHRALRFRNRVRGNGSPGVKVRVTMNI